MARSSTPLTPWLPEIVASSFATTLGRPLAESKILRVRRRIDDLPSVVAPARQHGGPVAALLLLLLLSLLLDLAAGSIRRQVSRSMAPSSLICCSWQGEERRRATGRGPPLLLLLSLSRGHRLPNLASCPEFWERTMYRGRITMDFS